jgi:hypothetical protein
MSSLDEIMPRHPCERCGRLHLVANGQPCLTCRAGDPPPATDDDDLSRIATWIDGSARRCAKLLDVLECALIDIQLAAGPVLR